MSLLLMLLTGVLLARVLGDAGRGSFAVVMAWYGMALVLGELGQSAAATYRVADRRRRADVAVASSRRVMTVTSAPVALAGVACSPVLAGSDAEVADALRVVFAAVLLNGLFAPFTYGLQAVSIRAWNLARISQPLAYLVLVAGTAASGRLSVVTAAICVAASAGVQLSVGFLLAAKAKLRGGRAEGAEARWLASYGVRQATAAVPSTMAASVDKVALSAAVSAPELGHYAVAQTVVGTSGAIGTALSSVAFPRLAGTEESGGPRVRKEGQLIVVAGVAVLGVAGAIAALSQWAIPFVYGSEFVESVPLAWWFVPVAVSQSTSLMAGTVLRGRALPGRAAWAHLSGLAITAIGLVASVPSWGVEGAAISLALGGLAATILAVTFWVVDARSDTTRGAAR